MKKYNRMDLQRKLLNEKAAYTTRKHQNKILLILIPIIVVI